jgi:hypothetical protein
MQGIGGEFHRWLLCVKNRVQRLRWLETMCAMDGVDVRRLGGEVISRG